MLKSTAMSTPDQPRPVRRSTPVVRRQGPQAVRTQPRQPLLSDTPGPDQNASLDEIKLTVAVIERPHGVQGEFQASLTTDVPERLLSLKSIYLGNETSPRKIEAARFHQDRIIFKLSGIDSPEQVRTLSKRPLRIPGSAAAPLAEGEYFLYQLIDSRVVDEAGTELGTLVDIMETGANEVYVVRSGDESEDLLLPNIASVVLEIDVSRGVIVVRPPEYL